MEKKKGQMLDECRRCGTCCRKGGPALHMTDRPLVEAGIIALKNLITIRRGEPSYDNISGMVGPADTDIIKIRAAAGGDTACVFLTQPSGSCSIYAHRPLECRALKCWDTGDIMACYRKDRLTRDDLLSNMAGLREWVAEHQSRCDYDQLAQLAADFKSGRNGARAAEAMMAMIRYDISLRQVTVEQTRLDDRLLLFLFGRPISTRLRWFQIKMVRQAGRPTVAVI
jgi:Fe-S-cluster containining protein